MNYKTLLIALFSPFYLCGQNLKFDSTEQRMVFRQVFQIDSASQNDLFTKGREWMVRTYKSAKKTIEVEDKEAGKLMTNGVSKVQTYNVHYNLTIEFKPGKARILIQDIMLKVPGMAWGDMTLEEMRNKKTREKIELDFQVLANDLAKTLAKKDSGGW